jgi:hypothetical protein
MQVHYQWELIRLPLSFPENASPLSMGIDKVTPCEGRGFQRPALLDGCACSHQDEEDLRTVHQKELDARETQKRVENSTCSISRILE